MGDRHTIIIQIDDDHDHKPENLARPTTSNTKVTMDLDLYKATIDGELGHFEHLSPSSVLEQATPLGNSFLHVAATFGREAEVKFIVSRYPDLIATRNSKGDTPLHAAVQSCNTPAIKALVHFAEKSPQRASSVEEGGVACDAALYYWSPDKLLELKNRQGNTALHEAMTRMADDGDHEKWSPMMEYLHDHLISTLGVEVLFVPNDEGKSPFYLAVEHGKMDLVKLMLDKCRGREDVKGKSPVNAAIRKRNKGMLATILNRMPAFIQLRDGLDGETPLHCAASTGDDDVIQYLLAKSCVCVLERDDNGYLPVHTASGKGRVKILKKLLEKYPKEGWRELLTNKGQNILHVAVENGKTEVVEYILKTPAHKELLNEKDDCGNTPLHLAAIHCKLEVLHALAPDKRIKLDSENDEGMTALDAADEGKVMTAKFRERLTWMALKSMGVPNKKCSKAPKRKNKEEYKETINALLLVAALVATVTYAAGFTMPGGYSDSDPNQGIAIMLHKLKFKIFIFCDTIAMFSSMIVVLCLIWAQLGDPNLILTFLRWALLFLGLALSMMSGAFIAGVYLVVKRLNWLANTILIMGIVFLDILMALFFPLFIPDTPMYPVIRHVAYNVFRLVIFIRNFWKKIKAWRRKNGSSIANFCEEERERMI